MDQHHPFRAYPTRSSQRTLVIVDSNGLCPEKESHSDWSQENFLAGNASIFQHCRSFLEILKDLNLHNVEIQIAAGTADDQASFAATQNPRAVLMAVDSDYCSLLNGFLRVPPTPVLGPIIDTGLSCLTRT